jgi:hypothetical protein
VAFANEKLLACDWHSRDRSTCTAIWNVRVDRRHARLPRDFMRSFPWARRRRMQGAAGQRVEVASAAVGDGGFSRRGVALVTWVGGTGAGRPRGRNDREGRWRALQIPLGLANQRVNPPWLISRPAPPPAFSLHGAGLSLLVSPTIFAISFQKTKNKNKNKKQKTKNKKQNNYFLLYIVRIIDGTSKAE